MILAALYDSKLHADLGSVCGILTDYLVIHCSHCNQGTCIKCQKLKFVSQLSVNFSILCDMNGNELVPVREPFKMLFDLSLVFKRRSSEHF